MSAFIVDRHHIIYMVKAAMSRRITTYQPFSWWHSDDPNPDSRHHKLGAGDLDEFERVCNMLWQENIRSVMYRYGDELISTLPGPIGEDHRITRMDHDSWLEFDPTQVLKSCKCYEYQSCEHPVWESSEAHAFIQSLKSHAINSLPGYENAEWGAPAPYSHPSRLPV